MFPQEIYRLFSLLQSLYDDIWFHDYLQVLFPHKNWDSFTSYKNVYKNYRRSGKIINYNGWTEDEGIGTSCIESGHNRQEVILTFAGELYLSYVLRDTRVVAIDYNTYVKEYEWYYYHAPEMKKVPLTPTSPFISVKWGHGDIFALTKEGIYHCYDPNFNENGDVLFLSYPDIKEMIYYYNIYVLDSYGNVYQIDRPIKGQWGKKYLIACGVERLYSGGLLMRDGTARLMCNTDFKNIPLSGKLLNVVEYDNRYLLQYDTGIYYCISLYGFDLYLITTCPVITKVKQIGGWCGEIFLIHDSKNPIIFPRFDEIESIFPNIEF